MHHQKPAHMPENCRYSNNTEGLHRNQNNQMDNNKKLGDSRSITLAVGMPGVC
jgi:hypothetical protein